MEDDELIGFERGHGLGNAIAIGELDEQRLLAVRLEILDYRAHLPARETVLGQVDQ